MKKIWTLWMASLFVMLASAQEAEQEKAFLEKAAALEKKINATEDNKEQEKYLTEYLAFYYQQPDGVQKKYEDAVNVLYYNLSYHQAAQGKKAKALKNFELACKNGFDNYREVLNDSVFDILRSNKKFKELHEKMRETSDYLYILQQSADYVSNEKADTLPSFEYMMPNDTNLVHVRQYFKLDSVAGAGNELSKIKNLLDFVHNTIRHDGSNSNPSSMNAIALYEACKDGSRGLNCRGLATVLKECYLAMGFRARLVTCMPKKYINDCHVINAIYSNTLDKWLWVDPTHSAMVYDEDGNPLSIQEVREYLRKDIPVVLNEDANWNNRSKTTAESYLYGYMAKNLYYLQCELNSCFDAETRKKGKPRSLSVSLCPDGYVPDAPKYSLSKYTVNDDAWFWQSPYFKYSRYRK